MATAERKNRSTESLHELIARQFGVVSTAQANEHGITASAITRRLASGEWARVLPGVYRSTAASDIPHQAAVAALLWAGAGALVSHGTAARLWNFAETRSRKTELWVPTERRLRSRLVDVHRSGRLDRADRTMLDGIAITTPARTLIDMAGRLEDDRLMTVAEDLFRRRLVTEDRLRARLGALRTSGRPGAGRLESLLDQRGGGRPLESALEVIVWTIILASGARLPVRQHWVTVTQGRYRLDFAWPDLKVGLECEGYQSHGAHARWGKDRARFAELGSVGWRVVPVTWEAATRDRARVVRWITSALASAA